MKHTVLYLILLTMLLFPLSASAKAKAKENADLARWKANTERYLAKVSADSTWLHNAVKKCAEHKLMVDIHDEYRPTGWSRTYPNLMTQEGIGGNEEMPDARHNTTLPFTRFLAGPADYTLCY